MKLTVSKRRSEVHDSSLPKESKEMVHMIRSFFKSPMVSLEKIAVLTLMLSLIGVGAAFAAAGGVPGRPTPPPPPCISTGYLQEDDTSVGSYFCSVRNVGATSHKVTVDFRDAANLTDERNLTPITLAPGHGIVFDFPPHMGFTASDACVVTTDEGTTDALQDLAVVLQFSSPVGETEGKIFNSCAPSSGVATLP
jgi:hypothetical protein